MKKYAVIVAGGSGVRMGTGVPKQFLQIKGKPILYYTILAFVRAYPDLSIILVLPKAYISLGTELAKTYFNAYNVTIAEGGDTRYASVKNGLQYVTLPSIVFVHDGVRCLIDTDLIVRCYQQAETNGSAIPVVAATDSIRIQQGHHHKVIDRNHVQIVQTPQTFNSALLLKAFELPYQPAFTDEATVVEAAGNTVWLIEGDYNNIKITRPIDMVIAEKLLLDKTIA